MVSGRTRVILRIYINYYRLVNDAAWGPNSVQMVQPPCSDTITIKKKKGGSETIRCPIPKIRVTKNGENFL